jgi:ribosomal protein S18 acetylase RimI-like enzyme
MDLIAVRPGRPEDAEFIRGSLREHFAGTAVAVHDELIDATTLPALIAWSDDAPAGLLTYRRTLSPSADNDALPAAPRLSGPLPAQTTGLPIAGPAAAPIHWEVVSLAASVSGRGVGTALLDALTERARAAGVTRIWLVTTNHNLNALEAAQIGQTGSPRCEAGTDIHDHEGANTS